MEKTEYKWRTAWEGRKNNIVYHTYTPTRRKVLLGVGIKVVGTAIGYFAGKKTGRLLQKIPYLSNKNLEKTLSIAGAVHGFVDSGAQINEENPDKLKSIRVSPFEITLRN